MVKIIDNFIMEEGYTPASEIKNVKNLGRMCRMFHLNFKKLNSRFI